MVNLDLDRNRILVSFPYREETVAQVKALGGGRYDRAKRAWRFPLTRYRDILAEFPDHWKGPVFARYSASLERGASVRTLPDAPQPVGIVVPLLHFQRVAANFLSQLPKALLLSRGVGVGKSILGIAWAKHRIEHDDRSGVLVVTKSAGKYPYRDEILRAVPGARVAVISGETGAFPSENEADWVVLNYDLLDARLEQIKARRFAAMILSESHKIKGGRGTYRGCAALELSREIPNVLLETASFTPNRNAEAFPQLCCIGLLDGKDDYFWFHLRFCDGHKIRIGRRKIERWDFRGSSNSDELHRVIAPYTYTILREEVLPELPKASFTPVLVDPTNAREYSKASRDFLSWIAGQKGREAALRAQRALVITKLNALLALAAQGNVGAAKEYIQSSRDAGEKILVFSSYKGPLKDLKRYYGERAVLITGDESAKQKDAARDRLQTSQEPLVCLCSTEAAGESLTLTAASTVVFLSLPWSPLSFSQAYGRSDRLGQTRPVHVIILVGRQTAQIEQLETLYRKEREISLVVTGDDRSPNSESLQRILVTLRSGNAGVVDADT